MLVTGWLRRKKKSKLQPKFERNFAKKPLVKAAFLRPASIGDIDTAQHKAGAR